MSNLSSGPLWRLGYEVDFTSLANQNLRTGGSGSKTIDGKTWTWANDGNCATANVVNGTGIVIVASATNTDYFNAVRTCPILSIPLQTALGVYSVAGFLIRVMARVQATGMDANFEGVKVGLESASAPTTANLQVTRIFTGGAVTVQATSTVGGTSTIRIATAADATKEVLGFTYLNRGQWDQWSGDFDAAQSPNMRLTDARWGEQILWTAGMNLNTDPSVYLAQQTGNASASLTTTFTHLRIDYAYQVNP